MSEYGFWNLAQKDPNHLALVEPDGREWRAGELLAASNRLVHGLRALGLQQGDCVATCLPNDAAMVQIYLAAAQAGWYLTPINHHLTAGEMAYILSDCEAKAFFGAGRFAAPCRDAAAQAGLPQSACYAEGEVPGFRPLAALVEGQPVTLPDQRVAGQVMNYTSGTTGRPKGVRRALAPYDPDTVCSMYAMFLGMFGIQPHADNVHLCGSPLYHTAVLVFAGVVAALRAHRRADGQMDAGALPRRHPALPGDHQPHGADPVSPLAGAARSDQAGAPTSPRCATWCTPRRPARST